MKDSTHGLCSFCWTKSLGSEGQVAAKTDVHPDQVAARARLAALDKREAPRETATVKLLALPHPWSNANEWEP